MQKWTYPTHHPPGDGPWRDEPDKVQWIDEETDLDCLAKRGPTGAWCGYVGVPPGHPWHGKDYDDLYDIQVHGGLTYANSCDEEIEDGWGICHIPEPGRPADVWWLGFDCAHYMDFCPRYDQMPTGDGKTLGDVLKPMTVYRDLAYVVAQTILLATQVKAVA